MKKGNLMRITALFFAMMICFTILSRAADQMSIAVVRTERPQNKMIEHTVKASGRVVQNQELAVTTLPDQRVTAIYVREGERVEKGDLLFEIDMTLLEEKILAQEMEMEKQQLQVKDAKSRKDVSAQQKAGRQAQAQEQYALSTGRAGVQLSRAKKQLDQAKKKLKEFQKSGGAEQEDSGVEETLLQTLGEKSDEYIAAQQELRSLEWEIENAVFLAKQAASSGTSASLVKESAALTGEADPSYEVPEEIIVEDAASGAPADVNVPVPEADESMPGVDISTSGADMQVSGGVPVSGADVQVSADIPVLTIEALTPVDISAPEDAELDIDISAPVPASDGGAPDIDISAQTPVPEDNAAGDNVPDVEIPAPTLALEDNALDADISATTPAPQDNTPEDSAPDAEISAPTLALEDNTLDADISATTPAPQDNTPEDSAPDTEISAPTTVPEDSISEDNILNLDISASAPENTESDMDVPASVPENTEPDMDVPTSVPESTEPDMDVPASVPESTEPDADVPASAPENTTQPENTVGIEDITDVMQGAGGENGADGENGAQTPSFDDLIIEDDGASSNPLSPQTDLQPPTPEELERIEQEVRDSYAQELEEARKKVEDVRQEKEDAEAALMQYQQERLASGNAKNKEVAQQLVAEVQAAQQAYEDAAIAANEAAVTSGREVQIAGIADASDSTDRENEITYEQMELSLDKLELLKENGGKICADADGLVTKINIMTGEKTTDTTAILMADLSKGCRFTADITKEQQKYIGTGDLVRLTSGDGKQKLEELAVESVVADEESGDLYHVTVQLPEDTLDVGMSASMDFTRKSEAYPVTVPLSALHLDGKQQAYVLVMEEYNSIMGTETRARRVDVAVQEQNESFAALAEGGLGSQQEVIVYSDKAVDEGSRVRVGDES